MRKLCLLLIMLTLPEGQASRSAGRVSSLSPSPEKIPSGLSARDWNSIRGEYERNRRAAFRVRNEYRARNAARQWLTRFDGRGFTVEPDGAKWRWGLELESYGLTGHERTVKGPAQVRAEKERVTYTWDSTVEEWFVNDERGLEHGFTLNQRPPGEGERLALQLTVRGGLHPQMQPGGRDISFLDAEGHEEMRYAGLKVWDAGGQILAARLVAGGDHLRLEVEESGARYPITIDPIVQQAYLKASNADGADREIDHFDSGDYFGFSVAVSGDTVVIGAPQEESSARKVNGDQENNDLGLAGAAYVFVRIGGVWSQQAYLKPSNTGDFDQFGWSVAISGDTVVVGACGEASKATGVNGNQTDNSAQDAGAAYVFVRHGGVWSQQAYLKASNTDPSDQFGWSVTVSGDTVVVGARLEDSNATGINGNQTDDSAEDSGAVYVFVRNGGVWRRQAYLKASNTDSNDRFGSSVALSIDTLVIGAPGEASSSRAINGNQGDNSAGFAGAAYVFVRSGGVWNQQAYVKASNAEGGDSFGSVAVSGDTVVVGAGFEGSKATGVNGNQSDNSADRAGAAYVFVRSAGAWSQQAYLKASNTEAGDGFGGSVAVSGDRVIIGAAQEDSAAIGVNGNQRDNSAKESGAAYLFARNEGVWRQRAYLKASNTGGTNCDPDSGNRDACDFFGAVSVSGDTIVVGAAGEDSGRTGLENGAYESGAAYVFSITPGNEPPEADAGSDQAVECTSPNGVRVTLDGRGSSDPDDDPLTFEWRDSSGVLSMADMFSLTLPRGRHPFTLWVSDGQGNRASDGVIVKVADTTRPRVTVQMTPRVLTHLDHRLVDVNAALDIRDACDRNPKLKLVSITSNEADSGLESGDLPSDIQGAAIGTNDRNFQLRAERSSKGSGRIYTVTYDVTDASGNTTRLTGEVKVP